MTRYASRVYTQRIKNLRSYLLSVPLPRYCPLPQRCYSSSLDCQPDCQRARLPCYCPLSQRCYSSSLDFASQTANEPAYIVLALILPPFSPRLQIPALVETSPNRPTLSVLAAIDGQCVHGMSQTIEIFANDPAFPSGVNP